MKNLLAKELKEAWQDVNGVFNMPCDWSVHWLWTKHNKEVSFKDCKDAWKIAINS